MCLIGCLELKSDHLRAKRPREKKPHSEIFPCRFFAVPCDYRAVNRVNCRIYWKFAHIFSIERSRWWIQIISGIYNFNCLSFIWVKRDPNTFFATEQHRCNNKNTKNNNGNNLVLNRVIEWENKMKSGSNEKHTQEYFTLNIIGHEVEKYRPEFNANPI